MKLSTFAKSVAVATTLSISSLSFAADIDQSADANDVAIKGYDTVAYFTEGKPVQGSSKYTATYKNAIYQFASAENRDAFKADKAKYAPAYGGYCAFGVAFERKFDTDPTAWKIVDGKLYLNLNKDVQSKWLKDVPGYLKESNGNWPEIKSVADAELAKK